jgi:multicomponent Na+:H+ antiporter subunit B
MSLRARYAMLVAGVGGLGALLAWAMLGLPSFGNYRGPYGTILNGVAVSERHTSNVVAAVVFDYRGLDTLGEEFIVLAAVFGVALLLREVREGVREYPTGSPRSDSVRAIGIGLAGATLLLGLYVVMHGYVTPGGGFQGGVVLSAAFALVYLAAGYRSYCRIAPERVVDFAKATGAGTYAVVGVVGLLVGGAYLENLLQHSLGTAGTLASSGSIVILNAGVGLEVGAAFVILFSEFLQELQAVRTSVAR